ncbi:uncharacterized protein LOC144110224 [Amblyomma americanum]
MEVEDLSVAPADDCRLVLGSSQNAAGTASALAVTADNPGVHVKRFCRCTHQRPPYTDAEMGESGFIQELRVKERNYKLMAVVLTVACIINLAVTGIGVAYLRLHFAQEDILSADSALPDSPHGRDQAVNLYSHIKAMIMKRRAKPLSSAQQTSTTPGYRLTRKRRTRWTSRFHFPDLRWLRGTTTSMAPKLFRQPSGYALT